jgi:hypothetical protein
MTDAGLLVEEFLLQFRYFHLGLLFGHERRPAFFRLFWSFMGFLVRNNSCIILPKRG